MSDENIDYHAYALQYAREATFNPLGSENVTNANNCEEPENLPDAHQYPVFSDYRDHNSDRWATDPRAPDRRDYLQQVGSYEQHVHRHLGTFGIGGNYSHN